MKKILIIFIIITSLALSFILILNATESDPPPPEECPFSLPEQGNLDGSLLRNDRTTEFINKIQLNEGNIITGETVTERVLQIAQVAAKCEVTLGSCGNSVKTISWLAGVQGLERGTTAEVPGKMEGDAGTSIRAISGDQGREICAIHCGRADCLKPCTDDALEKPNYEKKSEIYDKLKDEIRESGQTEKWPNLWASLLQPGDGFVVYNSTSEPQGSHYAIFMGWEDEEIGKAKVIQGAWGKVVQEGFIYVKDNARNVRRPLLRITRPE